MRLAAYRLHGEGTPQIWAPTASISPINNPTRMVSQTIIKPKVVVRGDLANVRIGRHCVVEENTVIRPPYKRYKK